MTLLNKTEVISKQIIRGGSPNGWRDTTYDATVGRIIDKDGLFDGVTYKLKPRGIVWLVSDERYHLPNNVTGITTLRTTWTKVGILTLTVGIVDPGYKGPLSTAVINFSGQTFSINKGDNFFRTAFFEHQIESEDKTEVSTYEYETQVEKDSNQFSESFLTIDTLATDIAPKIIGMPRWALLVGVLGLGLATILALLTLIIPPILGMSAEIQEKNARIDMLEKRIERLEGN